MFPHLKNVLSLCLPALQDCVRGQRRGQWTETEFPESDTSASDCLPDTPILGTICSISKKIPVNLVLGFHLSVSHQSGHILRAPPWRGGGRGEHMARSGCSTCSLSPWLEQTLTPRSLHLRKAGGDSRLGGCCTRLKQDGGCGKVSCLSARRRPGSGRPVGGSPFSLENRRCATRPPVEPQPPHVASPTPQASQKPGAAWNGRSQNGCRSHKAPALPGRLGRGRAPRPDHGHSSQPRGAVWGGRWGGGSRGGWGAREEPERGAGRGTKGPFVEWSREKRERITQCPEAMLVTREPFSASLGKQLGAERDRERFNPMGAGHRGLRPLWEVGRE